MTIPGIAVPQTLQTLALIMVIALLPAGVGIISVVLYLLSGALGAPVFADGGAGVSHLLGRTLGYLLGFLLAAIVLEMLLSKSQSRKIWYAVMAAFVVHIIILFCGWAWLGQKIGYSLALQHGVQPFMMGGLAKSLIAGIAVVYSLRFRRYLDKLPSKSLGVPSG